LLIGLFVPKPKKTIEHVFEKITRSTLVVKILIYLLIIIYFTSKLMNTRPGSNSLLFAREIMTKKKFEAENLVSDSL
jgi:hypothetical protein